MIFSDHICISCDKRFKSGDDIVVCPECGTPYHRECWLKNGECINEKLHENGQSYKESHEEIITEENPDLENSENNGEQKTLEKAICPICKEENESFATRCKNCGERLKTSEDLFNELMSLLEDAEKTAESNNSGRTKHSDFVGFSNEQALRFLKKNTMRYFPLFIMFSRNEQVGNNKIFSFNLAALLFPPLFFAYRKMTAACLAFLVALGALAAPSFIIVAQKRKLEFPWFDIAAIDTDSMLFQQIYFVCAILSYAIQIFAFLFADWLYYRHMSKKIRRINYQCGENVAQTAHLMEKYGGTSVSALVSAVFVYTFVGMLTVRFLITSVFDNLL
ncbi:MAG: hypothetical protein LBM93_15440 [Oscillospiraceae bacterium]|jgi:hypothetical protein|nr:hypothetical protein [Oscillospiraceae bacterium]